VVTLISVLALLPPTSLGKLVNIYLPEMAKQSDVIVLADVTSVGKMQGMKVATAQVRHGYKGNALTVKFLAQPTWTCDSSHAVVGERVLLFLTDVSRLSGNDPIVKLSKTGVYLLSHSGRGRIVLRESKSQWIAPVERYDKTLPWQLNVNLFLPKSVPVTKTGADIGTITLEKIVAAALPAPRQNR
jgi:hypothetical protein